MDHPSSSPTAATNATVTPIATITAAASDLPTASTVDDDGGCATPYTTAPSSPKSSDDSFSTAPPSPTSPHHSAAAAADDDEEEGFEFEFGSHLDTAAAFLSAEELFESGMIRPLRPLPPPPRLLLPELTRERIVLSAPKESYAPDMRNCIFSARSFSFDPFEAAIEATRKDLEAAQQRRRKEEQRRRKEEEDRRKSFRKASSFRASSCSSCSSFKSCRKWRLRDLFPFRGGAAAEGGCASFRSGGGSSVSGRSGPGLDRRLAGGGGTRGDGESKRKGETASSCKHRFWWECMRFNHGDPHGLVKGVESAGR